MCRVMRSPQSLEPQQGKKWDLQKAGKLEEFCISQHAFPMASGFAVRSQHTSARRPVGKGFSGSKGPVRNTTVLLWTTPFTVPTMRNSLPSTGGPAPHSHSHHRVSKYQSLLEGLPSRGKVDLGPGYASLRPNFGQLRKLNLCT